MRRWMFVVTAGTLAASCVGNDPLLPRDEFTYVGAFLNASGAAADVLVDGAVIHAGVPPSLAAFLYADQVPPGAHQITVRPSGATTGGATFGVTTVAGGVRNFVSYQAPGSTLSARVLEDTGAIVPADKSKVRVINLVPDSDIDIWRTQPDFQQATPFQFPFPFNPEPGPYIQSDAGAWTVWITSTANSTVKLHEIGPFTVPGGDKRTVIVVDSAGVLRLRLLVD